MAKQKRNIWDDLLNVGRRILKEIDDLFDASARGGRQPARVPVPVDKRRNGHKSA